jgi:hypothetical protein
MILKVCNYNKWIWKVELNEMDDPYQFRSIVKELNFYCPHSLW